MDDGVVNQLLLTLASLPTPSIRVYLNLCGEDMPSKSNKPLLTANTCFTPQFTWWRQRRLQIGMSTFWQKLSIRFQPSPTLWDTPTSPCSPSTSRERHDHGLYRKEGSKKKRRTFLNQTISNRIKNNPKNNWALNHSRNGPKSFG